MKYYPFVKKWSKIKPHLKNKRFQMVLVRDFNKFTYGKWKQSFKQGMIPFEFESCDWWLDKKGRKPEYWNYVKHAACHWLVNANLELAKLVEPNEDWQIVTSEKHSTVWNGNDILFDMNFSALGVDPQEAFNMAYEGELLEIGKHLPTYMAENVNNNEKTK